MHTRNTVRNLALASAVAAMLAAATPGVFAQVADTPAPPATTPTATPPGPTSITPENSNTTTPSATTAPAPDPSVPAAPDATSPAPMSSGAPMSPGMSGSASSAPSASDVAAAAVPPNFPTDYKVLSNRIFDNVDLEQSRARGLSDNQIATIVKICKETGFSYRYVSSAVLRGETFPELATAYNLKLGDVYSNDKEKQEISDYSTLYQAAESLGKNNGMSSSMPMDNSMPPMGSSTPMSPPMSPSSSSASSAPTLDIVDTAMAAKNLTTFVKALQIAGLVETLKGTGPFTVFAPDNKAFAKLPAGALDSLEADPAKLKQVLTYHVIPASIMASDAMAMTTPTSPPTVEGATLQVTKGKKGRLKVNDATVTKADIQASNGVIHVINMVLMPPADTTAPATTDTTMPAAPAPMDATPPTPPATPDTTTPPAAPDTTMPPAAPTPGPTDTTPATPPATPGVTPGQ